MGEELTLCQDKDAMQTGVNSDWEWRTVGTGEGDRGAPNCISKFIPLLSLNLEFALDVYR